MEATERRGPKFPHNEQAFLATLVKMLDLDGRKDAARVLTMGNVSIAYMGEDWRIERWSINIRLPFDAYAAMKSRDGIETTVTMKAQKLLSGDAGNSVDSTSILPEVEVTPVRGAVTNQGRAHSLNVAAIIEEGGRRFRSKAEVNLHRALKTHDITYAPLSVFVSGGRKVEPDFVLIKDGVVLVVEVDGPTHYESSVDAHKRLEGFMHNGIRVERVTSADCATEEKAKAVAEKLMALMTKYALQR
jgi:very-short-patch-repair endonuclease